MSFPNVYYERKVATARPCYICKRPTEVVLATLKTEDHLYTCEGHLTDPWVCFSPHQLHQLYLLFIRRRLATMFKGRANDSGFASLIPPIQTGPSADDIKKVVSDYHVREARKAVDAKDKDKDDNKDKDAKDLDKEKKDRETKSATNPSVAPVVAPAAPSHRKFALHRQMYDMRRAEIKRREQGVKAREVGKGLPQVPRGGF